MAANSIVPSDFPDERHPYAVKFVKDPLNKGKMEPEVFRGLWDRGCIEVDDPPMLCGRIIGAVSRCGAVQSH